MKKVFAVLSSFIFMNGLFAQNENNWATHSPENIVPVEKSAARQSFPKAFKLFDLNIDPLRQALFSVTDRNNIQSSTIISLPNAEGQIEKFEVYEASNFEPALQAQFPLIRAFSGRGITDKYATLKMSISPRGLQTMVFRMDKEAEFIEPYSQDHTVYAVYKSQRKNGQLPWSCSTADQSIATGINNGLTNSGITSRSGGDLKTMRLAQSVTAEYSNYFGATTSAQVSLVMSAINATIARCNGVYEKDLALHLNLIASTPNVIYYNPATDPYDDGATGSGGSWNNQLQTTLTNVIGDANYDIGHLFGASGGGGNAGCIGCVCLSGKGSGFTSPNDGVPQGDNFDIDYVVHEVGHQLGGNHTFSHNNEGSGVNKEPGSGITIMGYAGITAQDLAPHSIAFYHQATIAQIQANLATKTCPVTTTISNATPVVGALTNYTIPKSTPFALTGSATDTNAGDALSYSWEQNDNAGSTQTAASSVASPTKATGPNWISFSPTASPVRLFPKLATILAGGLISGPLTGGDAGANTEALSSVARILNFRLTVRDNAPYITSPASVGQTQFKDMAVTVSSASGPFAVSTPNTGVTWTAGSAQTVTWSVNGSDLTPVSCASVKISLSTDGGNTFPTVILSSTPNDGTEVITVPSASTTTARIKIEAVGNIFFDISNANFTISGTAPACGTATGLGNSAITTTSATVSWAAVSGALDYSVDYKAASSGTWISVTASTTATSAGISGLTASILYDWRVKANCSGAAGAYAQAQFTTAAVAGGGCGTAFEPNETTAAAAAISSGVLNSAAITTATDLDYFKITTAASGSLVYNLAGPTGVDYDLYVYNSAGTQIGSGAGSTATESVSLSAQAAGTYYIKVVGYNGALSSTCYTIKATFTASAPTGCQSTYDNTTNGTTSGAAAIPFNTNITGLINPANELDHYKFVITTGGTITVTLGTLPGDYDLKILNSAGTQVAISEQGSTTSESISYTAAAGTYYAQVLGYNGANSATVCYTLKVQLGTASKGETLIIPVAKSGFNVYPNPATDMINVRLTGKATAINTLQVVDIRGTVVIEKRIAGNTHALDISRLARGSYIIRVNGEAIMTSKFIKM